MVRVVLGFRFLVLSVVVAIFIGSRPNRSGGVGREIGGVGGVKILKRTPRSDDMKLAIPAKGPTLDSMLANRFGRSPYFIILDISSKEWESLSNPAAESQHGAGTQSAQFLIDNKIDAVVSSRFGPKAGKILVSAGVALWESAPRTVKTIMDDFLKGQLKPVEIDKHREPQYSERVEHT